MGNSEEESLANRIEYEIIVRREAQLEIQTAFGYYQDKSEGLGFEFLRSLDAALQSGEIRRLIRRFIGKLAAFCFANFPTRFSMSLKRIELS